MQRGGSAAASTLDHLGSDLISERLRWELQMLMRRRQIKRRYRRVGVVCLRKT